MSSLCHILIDIHCVILQEKVFSITTINSWVAHTLSDAKEGEDKSKLQWSAKEEQEGG